MKTARFEVYQDVSEQWRWRLIAANGRIIAQGESHSRKQDANRARRTVIETVIKAYSPIPKR